MHEQHYIDRLAYLSGEMDKDGEKIRHESLADFWAFVAAEPDAPLADLTVTNEGNIRARWEAGGAKVNAEFMGCGKVRVAMLAGSGYSLDAFRALARGLTNTQPTGDAQ